MFEDGSHPLIMAKLDSSRPARMALALFGLVGAGVLGVILGGVREAGWLSGAGLNTNRKATCGAAFRLRLSVTPFKVADPSISPL